MIYEKKRWNSKEIILEIPSFYNVSAARIRKIESWWNETEDYSEKMYLLVNMQGTNRFGGTLYKDYVIMCEKDMAKASAIKKKALNRSFKRDIPSCVYEDIYKHIDALNQE